MPTALSSHYKLFLFVLSLLTWAVPVYSRVTPRHRTLSNRLSRRSGSPESIAATWYAGWHSSDYTLQDLSWDKYSMVFWAFAETTPDVNVLDVSASDAEVLPQFVQTAHENNVIAVMSIGGWTGSRYFSSAMATDSNRTAFAQAVMSLVSTYNLDGVEIDWEYPANQGIGCNVVSVNDSANFLAFLNTLRNQDGADDMIITAAVSVLPFIDRDGKPMKDVSAFAKVLDFIEIMNYDVWGSWCGSVGPNAPLNDICALPADQEGSAVSAVNAWSAAGFLPNQIILGVASYGHSFHINQSSALNASGDINLYPPFDKSLQPTGDVWDGTAVGVDVCGNPNVVGGVVDFWGLIDAGFLLGDGTVAECIEYAFDNCAKTPYVYNSTSEVMVSFDDAISFAAKGKFIKDANLAGFAMWEAGGDSNDILLDAITFAICST